jgi:hypothetical protein
MFQDNHKVGGGGIRLKYTRICECTGTNTHIHNNKR